MKANFKTITPDIAKLYLQKNTKNRTVTKSRVDAYCEEMKSGNWVCNGDTIRFDINGNLINGQHRLLAIIKSDKPIDILVVEGLPLEAFTTIDTGKMRNAKDVFNIEGVQNSVRISSGINRYLSLSSSQNIKNARVVNNITNAMILEEYNSNKDLYIRLQADGATYYRAAHRIITVSDYIAFYRYFQLKYSSDIILSFFDALINREGVCELLYNRLLTNIISNRKINASDKYALIIKAFNFFVNKKQVKVLKFQPDEQFPKI